MDSNYILTSDGQLFHWGIKGMKWGVRRYQNADGSLTAAGRKKYAAESKKLKEREQVIKNRERVKARQDKLNAKKSELDAREKALKDAKKSEKSAKIDAIKGKLSKKSVSEAKKKSIADMSDEELQKLVNRVRLEDQYKQLRPDPVPKKNRMLAALEPVLIDAGKNLAKNALDKIGKNLMKEKLDPDSLEALTNKLKKLETKKKIAKLENDDDTDDGETTYAEKNNKATYEKNQRDRAAGLEDMQRTRTLAETMYGKNNPKVEKALRKKAKELGIDYDDDDNTTNTSNSSSSSSKIVGTGTKSLRQKLTSTRDRLNNAEKKEINTLLAEIDNMGWKQASSSTHKSKLDSLLNKMNDEQREYYSFIFGGDD